MEILINNKVRIKGITYKVVGVDSYKLFNSLDKEVTWKSYTLVGDDVRVGISFTEGKYIFWDKVDFSKYSDLFLNMNLTGICNISFEGDKGPSTPIAELVWFNSKENIKDNLLIEKFIYFDDNNRTIKKSITFFQKGIEINEKEIKVLE